MKRTLLSVLLIAASLACIQAQGTTLSIQNQENAWFYFIIDPAEMKGLAPTSPSLPGLVSQYFARETDKFPFTPLEPNSGLKVEGLPEGAHILVGFHVFEDRDEFPVRVVALQVDGRMGERFYPIYSDPALLSASRQKGKLIRFARTEQAKPAAAAVVKEEPVAVKEPAAVKEEPAIQASAPKADDAAPKAETAEPGRPEAPAPAAGTFPPLAAFAAAFHPEVFTREDADGLFVFDIRESKHWGKPGTAPREVRAELADGILSLTILSWEPFAQNVSYFFYIYGREKAGARSPFTVEVKPVGRSGPGVAILWEQDTGNPMLHGETAAVGGAIRVQMDMSALPERFWKALGDDPGFDLTSCWYDGEAGFYEEFYLTSFTAADIPGG